MPTSRTKIRPKPRAKKQSYDASDLLLMEMKQIHSAESQLMRALPRLARKIESERIASMIDGRLEECERITQDIDEMGESPGRKKNIVAEALIEDAREHAQETEPGPALDAIVITALQKTEHYCIAAWGTVKALAAALGQDNIVKVMERALDEGKAFDRELSQLAQTDVTPALVRADKPEDAGDSLDEEGSENPRKGRASASRATV